MAQWIAVATVAAISFLGVLGMRERVNALGGRLTLTPRSEGGLRVEVVLPADAGAATNRIEGVIA